MQSTLRCHEENRKSIVKVLFVPHPMPSHLMPLMALARTVRHDRDIECAFLLPQRLHNLAKRTGVALLDIDRQLGSLNSEMKAVSKFRPTVVVDDLSPTTVFLSRLLRLPRISIVRKGLFPGDRDFAHYPHSSGCDESFEKLKQADLPTQGLWDPAQLTDMYLGDVNLIPSCPAIEDLPGPLRGDPRYRYTGPLLLDDGEIGDQAIADRVSRFLDAQSREKIVYFTIGLATPTVLKEAGPTIIRTLLDLGATVVSNVDAGTLPPAVAQRFFCAPFLPMNQICSRTALMIHQCGSATYAYQLLHGCPGIILGSKARDRDAVASRLAQLGAATYFPAEDLERGDLAKFYQCVSGLLGKDSSFMQRQAASIASLRARLLQAAHEFDFAEVLRVVVARRPDPAPLTLNPGT